MVRHLVLLSLLAAPALAAAQVSCENGSLAIDAGFDGGRLDHCEFSAADSVELTFRAEDYRVSSAFSWFAFRIAADEPREATVKLQFPDSYARFWPKLSRDGHSWTPAAEESVARSEVGKSMTLTLEVDESGLWVSAQELLTERFYEDWLLQLDTHFELETRVIGASRQGRPIHLASTGDRPEAVILLGRQHPVEVPGAIAMREFVDVVMGSSKLAREFRERFMLLIIPLVNPDGVALGHARHNDGLTDLNRDWGPFTQPETQAVAALLEELEADGVTPRLMLDFHATKQWPTMIFYTQVPEDDTDPKRFASHWLGRVDERIDGFEFKHDPRPPSEQGNAKNYFFKRYGIPSITYEMGDEVDRDAIIEHTPVFAEEMMRTMLEAP
jgi:predicted deacylase